MKHPDIRTPLEKKTQRKISRGSKRGRYVVGRRRSRARPGRKRSYTCDFCNNTLPANSDNSVCTICKVKNVVQKTMNIPGMTKK